MVERQRARNLNIRITDDEGEMLRQLAEREGVSASDVVRLFIRRAHAEAFPAEKSRAKR
jgi:uncharacterized protein (DUF1778 family)